MLAALETDPLTQHGPIPFKFKDPMAKAFIAPLIAYLIGTSLVAQLDRRFYPLGYTAVVVACAVLMFLLWRDRQRLPFKIHWRIVPGILVGLVGIAAWIGISHLHLEKILTTFLPDFLRPGERVSFDPFEQLDGFFIWMFIAVRLVGIALVVPIAEELFWRGFLLRWLIKPEWEEVEIGTYSIGSFAMTTLLFTLAHPEWFAAAAYCLLLNAFLYRTKDLWQCIVAHAVSNLTLAIYVLATGEWWLW